MASRHEGTYFSRCEFWQDPTPSGVSIHQNTSVFSANHGHGSRAEEVAVWGYGRKMSSVYKSNDVHDSQMWIRYDGFPVQAKATGWAYRSERVSLTDSIVVMGGTDDLRVAPPAEVSVRGVATDPQTNPDALAVLDNVLFIDQSLDSMRTFAGFSIDDGRGTMLFKCHSVVRHTDRPYILSKGAGNRVHGSFASNSRSLISEDWPDSLVDITVGVREDLWPTLPSTMWERIERATNWSAYPKAIRT